MKRFLALAFVATAAFVPVQGWGNIGHEAVGAVAQQLLNKDVDTIVSTLLASDSGSMSTAATWADQIKRESGYTWSEELHYIDTPDKECGFDPVKDCPSSKCVSGAIKNYTARVTKTQDVDAQTEALKFLIHFVGDIHQPLHVAFASDRGGNSIKGHFFTYEDNLHSIWDTYIIEDRIKNDFGGSNSDYIDYLVGLATGDWSSSVQSWMTHEVEQPDTWAVESAAAACKYAYVDTNNQYISSGFTLADDYYQRSVPVIENLLVKAGARLAAVLNKEFSSYLAAI